MNGKTQAAYAPEFKQQIVERVGWARGAQPTFVAAGPYLGAAWVLWERRGTICPKY